MENDLMKLFNGELDERYNVKWNEIDVRMLLTLFQYCYPKTEYSKYASDLNLGISTISKKFSGDNNSNNEKWIPIFRNYVKSIDFEEINKKIADIRNTDIDIRRNMLLDKICEVMISNDNKEVMISNDDNKMPIYNKYYTNNEITVDFGIVNGKKFVWKMICGIKRTNHIDELVDLVKNSHNEKISILLISKKEYGDILTKLPDKVIGYSDSIKNVEIVLLDNNLSIKSKYMVI